MQILKKSTRTILVICAIALLIVLILPIWRIELNAPQYPEGLVMLIFANKLGGSVDIINGLNHYIGMKTLHEKDFLEFKVIPGIIIFFSVFFMLAAFVGKRKLMNVLLGCFLFFGITAMIDFWRWEYQYGHDLNPDAAIRIPGMAYQPPLIGFKQLLNFGAYSVPDIGGWIFILVGLALLGVVVFEQKRVNQYLKIRNTHLVLFFLSLGLFSCNIQSDPIKLGRDNCHFCKMTISDNKFGSEIVTKKGKVYKFDDTQCMISFLQNNIVEKKEIGQLYLVDFSGSHELLKVSDAYVLKSDLFVTPMKGFYAAFSDSKEMQQIQMLYKAKKVSWNEVIE